MKRGASGNFDNVDYVQRLRIAGMSRSLSQSGSGERADAPNPGEFRAMEARLNQRILEGQESLHAELRMFRRAALISGYCAIILLIALLFRT